jgi:hypothetical protein
LHYLRRKDSLFSDTRLDSLTVDKDSVGQKLLSYAGSPPNEHMNASSGDCWAIFPADASFQKNKKKPTHILEAT